MNYNETLELLKSYTPLVKDYGDKFKFICGFIQNSLIPIWKLTETEHLYILTKQSSGSMQAHEYALSDKNKIIDNLKIIIPIMKNLAMQKQIKKIDKDFQ